MKDTNVCVRQRSEKWGEAVFLQVSVLKHVVMYSFVSFSQRYLKSLSFVVQEFIFIIFVENMKYYFYVISSNSRIA